MNILLICNKFPFPPRDGGSLASYNMAKGLAEAGNRVDLLAMNTSKHYSSNGNPDNVIPGVNMIRKVYVDTSVSYTGLIINLLFSSFPYNARRFINLEFERELDSMLLGTTYDIVQLEGLYLAPYVKNIRGNSDALIVYRAHNIEHIIWESYYRRGRNPIKKLYLGNLYKRIRSFEQNFVNEYDLLVSITNVDLEHFKRMGNKKPSIVAPFGMYPDKFPVCNHSDRGDYCLQYIGALDWMPNIDGLDWFIRKVWGKLKNNRKELRFVVAGRNAKSGYNKHLVKNRIDFRGEVENASEYLLETGILVVPLFSGSGIRVRIIEAMLMGKPVIATSFAVSGIPAESGTHLLIADDENAFTESVEMMLDDKEWAFRIGNNARDFVLNHYTNGIITKELTAFYKKNLK